MKLSNVNYSFGRYRYEKVLPQYEAAIDLEHAFGNPWDCKKTFSYSSSLELDEVSLFPWEWSHFLDQWGANNYFVPKSQGGQLSSFEELVNIFRSVFRRDATLGLGYGATTFMAAVPIWVAGNKKQKASLARTILNHNSVSIAYHERNHGNDVLGNEVFANKESNGYELNGEKWIINNATRSRALTLFARTNTYGGSRGFSVFSIDKFNLDGGGEFQYLKKVKTHGVRGCQIGGLKFNDCLVPQTSLIGKVGNGLEISLKAFQITRSVLPGMALGCAETALRTCTKYQLDNTVPNPGFPELLSKQILAKSFLDFIICECVTIGASRALHVIPEQMSLYSSIVKYFVPIRLQRMMKGLSPLLGVQCHLRDGNYGVFQKLSRDLPVVALGHASSVICLASMIPQLKSVSQQRLKGTANSQRVNEKLDSLFTLNQGLPDFDANQLSLMNSRGRDYVISGLNSVLKNLHANPMCSSLDHLIIKYIAKVVLAVEVLDQTLASMVIPDSTPDPIWYQLAEQYCVIHAASACIHLWWRNRQYHGGFFSQSQWILVALHELLTEIGVETEDSVQQHWPAIFDELLNLYHANQQFSINPFQLAY